MLHDPPIIAGEAPLPDGLAIHVQVENSQTKERVQSVSVWLARDTIKDNALVTVLTDLEGRAALRPTEADEYWLGADLIGFASVRARVRITADRADTVVLPMQAGAVGCETRRR